MAKRVSVITYPTDEVQGEGSYVTLSALKVKEIRALRKKSKGKGKKGDEDFDAFEGGLEILAAHVLDWNWVGDEDELLSLPKNDPGVVDELTNDEAEFLSALLTGDEEAKNSEARSPQPSG